MSKLAREHVTVVLSGDGGDELSAGYTRYLVDLKRSGFARLPQVVREGMLQPLSQHLPHGAWGRNYIHNVALDLSTATSIASRCLRSSTGASSTRTTSAASCKRHTSSGRFGEYSARVKTGEPLDRLLYIDSKTYLPGDILTKVDRMSMAASLEARVPLLDHKLIEFVTRMPASMKVRGLQAKHIFKRAARGLVPDEILDRPKQGFGMPLQQWINHQLRDRIYETLTERRAERGYINSRYVRLLLDEHRRGRRDHSRQLWALFMLELWHRKVEEPAHMPGVSNILASAVA
ncbi:MAG: asparagine synthase C-terminal domain-containing protein [Pyrinomonadaceae bacterium]